MEIEWKAAEKQQDHTKVQKTYTTMVANTPAKVTIPIATTVAKVQAKSGGAPEKKGNSFIQNIHTS